MCRFGQSHAIPFAVSVSLPCLQNKHHPSPPPVLAFLLCALPVSPQLWLFWFNLFSSLTCEGLDEACQVQLSYQSFPVERKKDAARWAFLTSDPDHSQYVLSYFELERCLWQFLLIGLWDLLFALILGFNILKMHCDGWERYWLWQNSVVHQEVGPVLLRAQGIKTVPATYLV